MNPEKLIHKFTDFNFIIDLRENQSASRLHTHNFDEITIVLKGSAINVVDGRNYPIMRGDVFVIHGNQAHKIINPKNLTLANVIYERNSFEKIKDELRELPGFSALFVYEPIYRKHNDFKAKLHLSSMQIDYVKKILSEFKNEQESQKPGCLYIIESLFKQLIVNLCRNYHHLETPDTKSMLKVSKVIDYMEKNFEKKITIANLSELVKTPPTTFRWTFKKITGASPIDYLIRMRIEKSIELMNENPSMHVIDYSLMSGFENTGYFGKKFKEISGSTPFDYLKKIRDLS